MANYAIWRYVQDSADYLTNDVQDIREEFYSKLEGTVGRRPRWKKCMDIVSKRYIHVFIFS